MNVKKILNFTDKRGRVLEKEKNKLSFHRVKVLGTISGACSTSDEDYYEVILENKKNSKGSLIVRDRELDKKESKNLIKVSDEIFNKLIDIGINKGLDLYDLNINNYSKGNAIIKDCNDIEFIVKINLLNNNENYYIKFIDNDEIEENIEVKKETFNKLLKRYKTE